MQIFKTISLMKIIPAEKSYHVFQKALLSLIVDIEGWIIWLGRLLPAMKKIARNDVAQ